MSLTGLQCVSCEFDWFSVQDQICGIVCTPRVCTPPDKKTMLPMLPPDVLQLIADILWFDVRKYEHNGRTCISRPNWQQANYVYRAAVSDVLLTYRTHVN